MSDLPQNEAYMMEAFTVYGHIRELAALGRRGKLSRGELAAVHRLMGVLRDCGFSSSEVSGLVGRRWGSSAVRRYAVGSGVVDSSGKDRLFELVAGFAAAGVDLAEVEACRVAKLAMGGVGLDFAGAVRLSSDLGKCRGSPEEVERLAWELAGGVSDKPITVGEVRRRLKLEVGLDAKGLTQGIQLTILKTGGKYGDAREFLEAMSKYEGLLDILGEVDSLRKEEASLKSGVVALKSEKVDLTPRYLRRRVWSTPRIRRIRQGLTRLSSR